MDKGALHLRHLLDRPTRSARDEESAVTEPADEYAAFGHGRVGNRPQLTLLFRTCDGRVFGYPYANFMGIRSDDPERGFTVEFAGKEIVVQGQNLGALFRYVCDHKAAEIVEADRGQTMLAHPQTPLVEAIVVSPAVRMA